MRRSLLPLAVALALVGAPAALSSHASDRSTLVRLVSVTTAERTTDVAPKGVSKGDKYVASSRLLNAVAQFGRPKGARVGGDAGTMTVTGPSSVRLVLRTTLPGGTIRVDGRMTLVAGGGIRFPVVGGTGRFAGVTGTLSVSGLGGSPKRALNVYALVYPV